MEADGGDGEERSVAFTGFLDQCLMLGLVLGKVRSIGVSNFSQMKLEEILPAASIVPVVNQVSFCTTLESQLALMTDVF